MSGAGWPGIRFSSSAESPFCRRTEARVSRWLMVSPPVQCASPVQSPASSAAQERPCASPPWTPPQQGWRQCPVGRTDHLVVVGIAESIARFGSCNIFSFEVFRDKPAPAPMVGARVRLMQGKPWDVVGQHIVGCRLAHLFPPLEVFPIQQVVRLFLTHK